MLGADKNDSAGNEEHISSINEVQTLGIFPPMGSLGLQLVRRRRLSLAKKIFFLNSVLPK